MKSSSQSIRQSLPRLVALPGISGVTDISDAKGEPAMLVELVDGVRATVTRCSFKKARFAVVYEDDTGARRMENRLTERELMTLLNDFAFVAANRHLPLLEVICAGLNRKE